MTASRRGRLTTCRLQRGAPVPNDRDWARVSASPRSRPCGGRCHVTRLLLRFATCCLIAAPPTRPAFRVRARRQISAARRRSRHLPRGRFSSPISPGEAAVLTVTARPACGWSRQPPPCRSDVRCVNTVGRSLPCICRAPCPSDVPLSQSRRRAGALPYATQRRLRRPTRHRAASKGRKAGQARCARERARDSVQLPRAQHPDEHA